MKNRNLVLELRLHGETGPRVLDAARIQVDGRGLLLLYDAWGALLGKFPLRELESFSIRQPSRIAAKTVA